MAIIQTPSIAAVVEDQTPQLGGNLDCQDYQLQWSGSSQFIGSLVATAGLNISSGTNNIQLTSNGIIDINTNGASRAKFEANGGLSVDGAVAPMSVDSFYDLGKTALRWNTVYADSLTIGDGVDAILTADAANELALRNGANAQKFSAYSTYTDASNYERLSFGYSSGDSEYQIKVEDAGTGLGRDLRIESGTSWMEISNNSTVFLYATNKKVFQADSANTFLYASGTPLIQVTGSSLNAWVDGSTDLGTTAKRFGNTYTDTITIGDGVDAILTADAADTLALRNSTNAQAFNVYNTYTDASNYERLEVKWDSNIAKVSATSAGTGSDRSLYLEGAEVRIRNNLGQTRWLVGSSNTGIYQDFVPAVDSNYDLGYNANRWATTYTDGIATNVETFTATSDTLDALNNVALCDCTSNNITINLPAASTASGLQYHIKKIDSSANTVTVDGNGSETIDGATTQVISNQYDSMTIVSDGSNWFIL